MYTVAAFYHFAPLQEPACHVEAMRKACCAFSVKGTILIAPEGINGTIAGMRNEVHAVLDLLKALPNCTALEWKESTAQDPPFSRLKVRLKREIVTMKQPQVRPVQGTGHYVEPKDWNALIESDDVITIDTRNDYEIAIGTFKGAIDPHTKSFSEFPAWWEANQESFAGKRVAMFCTGGIRCEKSTNYLLGKGVSEVYHLKGGILKYLEDVPEAQSNWDGACFVFDERVSILHGLKEGEHQLCRACRRPLTIADTKREEYEPGVQCHYCLHEYTDEDRKRFRIRQQQYERNEYCRDTAKAI